MINQAAWLVVSFTFAFSIDKLFPYPELGIHIITGTHVDTLVSDY